MINFHKTFIRCTILFMLIYANVALAVTKQNETDMFSVQWDEHIIPYYLKQRASSVEDFKRLLVSRWKEDDGSDFNFLVQYREGISLREKTILNCADLISSFEKISSVKTNDISFSNLLGWRSSCEAIKRLSQMSRSRISNVSLDVKSLLADLSKIQIDSEDEIYRNYFKELNRISKLKCKRQSMCVATTKNEIMRVQVDAVGDFNHDGIQDAIVLSNSGPRIGNGNWFIGVVVTRIKAGGELKVLDWW